MLQKAIQYIIGLSAPTIHECEGRIYSDKPLHQINRIPHAEPIKMNTLSSLVEYLKSNVDYLQERFLLIHIQSPTKISVFSSLDDDREREYLVEVNAQVPSIEFGRFIDHESFCIGLQSKFIDSPNSDRALLLKFAGTVEAGSVAEYGDDGISQKATIKTGIASKGEALVPSPVSLKPYRTFTEVEQPVSSFVFRMKQDKYDGIQCALFEADGGAWKNFAMAAIKSYLQTELAEYPEFIIIS